MSCNQYYKLFYRIRKLLTLSLPAPIICMNLAIFCLNADKSRLFAIMLQLTDDGRPLQNPLTMYWIVSPVYFYVVCLRYTLYVDPVLRK